MRIADNPDRERLWETLVECSDQQTKSKAIEDAARYYCRMRGGGGFNSKLDELLSKAIEQGSVTPQEIVEVLDTRELPMNYRAQFSFGDES